MDQPRADRSNGERIGFARVKIAPRQAAAAAGLCGAVIRGCHCAPKRRNLGRSCRVNRMSSMPRNDVPQPPPAPRGPSLGRIFLAFFRLGGTSFGGGTAAWLHREMVLRRSWIDDPTFLRMLAVVQVMPGSNGVNLTVLVGQHLRGAVGAAAALLGLLAAPFAIVLAIGALYLGAGEHAVMQVTLDGVAAIVIGLTFATGLGSLARGAASASSWAVAATTVLFVGVLRWPILPVILGLAPVSIGICLLSRRRR
jgi:chromate transporter